MNQKFFLITVASLFLAGGTYVLRSGASANSQATLNAATSVPATPDDQQLAQKPLLQDTTVTATNLKQFCDLTTQTKTVSGTIGLYKTPLGQAVDAYSKTPKGEVEFSKACGASLAPAASAPKVDRQALNQPFLKAIDLTPENLTAFFKLSQQLGEKKDLATAAAMYDTVLGHQISVLQDTPAGQAKLKQAQTAAGMQPKV